VLLHEDDMLTRDVRFAVRTLLKAPGFTALAVLVLGLGIGANTAVFSLVNGALLRPGPGADKPGEVVGIYSRDRAHPDTYRDFSYPNYLDIKPGNPAFGDVAAMTMALVGYREGDETRRVFASLITSNYFSVFGAPMALGRSFTPQEEVPGAGVPVLVVSHEFWTRRGADPQIVGSTIVLNATRFTVVGVAGRGVTAAGSIISPSFWLPMGAYEMVVNEMFRPGKHNTLADRLNNCLLLFGRTKPGVDAAAVEGLLRGLSRQMERQFPADNKDQVLLGHRLPRFSVSSSPHDDGQIAAISLLLFGLTAIVLAIACLNVANMLLARGTARRKEFAIRLALGSGRAPVMRQLLVEGLLLSLGGGLFGLLLASWSTRALVSSMAPVIPMLTMSLDPSPDARVLLATLTSCAVSTLLFALGPAWRLSRTDVVPELKEQGGETGRPRRWPFSVRQALVVGQVALSLGLLTSAGLFVRAAGKAAGAEPGFRLEQSILLNRDASIAGYDEAKGRDAYRRVLERVRALPGVQSASLASIVPFGEFTMGRSVEKVGDLTAGSEVGESSMSVGGGPAAAPRDRGNSVGVNYYVVGAAYLRTLGVRLLRGREFTEQEERGAGGAARVVIDETLARKLFPNQDPVGQYIRFTDRDGGGVSREANAQPAMEIVGVSAPIRHSLFDAEARPQVFVPFGEHYQGNMFVHVKARRAGSESTLMRTLRQELRNLDDRLPVLSLRTFADHRDASISVWTVNTAARLFGAIGLAAVFLALVGVYGVKAYLVSRRTREIGIRMSLGATPQNVLWMVIEDGVRLAAAGLVIGIGLSALMALGLRGLLYQVSPFDLLTFIAAPLLLAAATIAACYVPARRAMRVSPLRALRFE
jgi:predicted permease